MLNKLTRGLTLLTMVHSILVSVSIPSYGPEKGAVVTPLTEMSLYGQGSEYPK